MDSELYTSLAENLATIGNCVRSPSNASKRQSFGYLGFFMVLNTGDAVSHHKYFFFPQKTLPMQPRVRFECPAVVS